jgi:hypothetical protein
MIPVDAGRESKPAADRVISRTKLAGYNDIDKPIHHKDTSRQTAEKCRLADCASQQKLPPTLDKKRGSRGVRATNRVQDFAMLRFLYLSRSVWRIGHETCGCCLGPQLGGRKSLLAFALRGDCAAVSLESQPRPVSPGG